MKAVFTCCNTAVAVIGHTLFWYKNELKISQMLTLMCIMHTLVLTQH